jgi:hypothetical protein
MPEPIPTELLEKRRILYAKGQEKRRAALAAVLASKGRLAEALEYLERGREEAVLHQVRKAAVMAGDAFALSRSCQILKVDVDPSEWRDLAARAEAAGKYLDAVNAWEKAGEAEKAETLRLAKCPEFRPFKPAGK